MTAKRFTITQDFEEHHRQIRDNGKIIMGCFLEPQAEPIVKLLNELHEENQILRKALKNTYYNEICEVCKYGKYERNWYGEGEFECLKKHFGNEDWKCDGLKECDDFELDIKRFLK